VQKDVKSRVLVVKSGKLRRKSFYELYVDCTEFLFLPSFYKKHNTLDYENDVSTQPQKEKKQTRL